MESGFLTSTGLEVEPEDMLRAARLERGCIVDAVAGRERGHDDGQELVPDVRPARRLAEMEVPPHELLQAEMRGERGRQEEARISHELRPVERRAQPGRGCGKIASGRCSSVWADGLYRNAITPVQKGTCSCVPDRESRRGFGGSGLMLRN